MFCCHDFLFFVFTSWLLCFLCIGLKFACFYSEESLFIKFNFRPYDFDQLKSWWWSERWCLILRKFVFYFDFPKIKMFSSSLCILISQDYFYIYCAIHSSRWPRGKIICAKAKNKRFFFIYKVCHFCIVSIFCSTSQVRNFSYIFLDHKEGQGYCFSYKLSQPEFYMIIILWWNNISSRNLFYHNSYILNDLF